MYVPISLGVYAPNSFPHLYQGQTEPFKVGREFAAQVVCQVSPESELINFSGHFLNFYEYLWLYLYVFSILFLWLYEWLVSTFYKQV